MKAPVSAELARLPLALRITRFLVEPQGLLERDAENGYPPGSELESGATEQFMGLSII